MKYTLFCIRLLGCFAAVSLSALTVRAQEEQRDWTNPSGGSFGDAGNWDGGVPQSGDLGWFNLSSAGYTVDLDGDRDIGALQVANDNVVLNLNGFVLDLTDSTTGDWPDDQDFSGTTSLMIGRGLNGDKHTGNLTLNGGGIVNVQGFTVGGSYASEGTFIVEGVGTTLNVLGSGINNAIIGYRETDATMIVRGGAQVDFGTQLTMGRHAAGNKAELRIQGENTSATFTTRIDLGNRGESSLYVENGATLSSASGFIEVAGRARDASLTVDGGVVSIQHIRVSFSEATGTLSVLNGGEMNVSGLLRVADTNRLENQDSIGIVTIDGEGSTLVSSGNVLLSRSNSGEDGGVARLTVSNGGSLNSTGIIYAMSKSTIAIDGGTLSAAELRGVAGATLDVTLNSGEFGPLITVTGPTASTIDDMILQVALGDQFTASVGDVFMLLDYVALTGTFADYAEGDQIEVGGYVFDISYGIDAEDMVSLSVSAIPEPATVALIFALLTLGVATLLRRK